MPSLKCCTALRTTRTSRQKTNLHILLPVLIRFRQQHWFLSCCHISLADRNSSINARCSLVSILGLSNLRQVHVNWVLEFTVVFCEEHLWTPSIYMLLSLPNHQCISWWAILSPHLSYAVYVEDLLLLSNDYITVSIHSSRKF